MNVPYTFEDLSDETFQDICEYADTVKDYLPAFTAFTLSPRSDVFKSSRPYDQYRTLLQNIFGRVTFMLKTFSKFLFVPEMRRDGTVHIHGYYNIKDKVSYYRWFIPICKSYGFLDFKYDVDEYWIYYYVSKEVVDTKRIMKEDNDIELPIPLTEKTIIKFVNKIKPQYYKAKPLRPKKVKYRKLPFNIVDRCKESYDNYLKYGFT